MADAGGSGSSHEGGKQCKIVVVGDGRVGKTCLLWVYAKGEFPPEYTPTVFDNYTATVEHRGEAIKLELWDTAGQEDYDRIRSLAYNDTNVFLLCFSVMEADSLANIKSHWATEVSHHCPSAHLILVATKVDQRDDPAEIEKLEAGKKPLTAKQGEEVAKKIGAIKYMETSAKEDIGVKDVFDEAIRCVLKPRKPPSGRCRIL
eukprot:NODE_3980_length_854_cov_25.836025_g3302_i0.p1 GENE.NODE_3980_length_854_cov_25.836025_g3302_i0~~NODE_3980_length_854_cov_25.836025_g3302_i0.p1  ORF type:complete len:203 (+),score=33.91 NODE_3980_length_854_cov_25.836025_g3302_i0:212-820(+)